MGSSKLSVSLLLVIGITDLMGYSEISRKGNSLRTRRRFVSEEIFKCLSEVILVLTSQKV